MSASEALGISLPKLPELDSEDVKAIRGSLLGKVLSRAAALLALLVIVLELVNKLATNLGLKLPQVALSPPWLSYALLLGLPVLVVAVHLAVEWRAAQVRRARQGLAVRTDTQQAGYFRIGPYLNTPEDRAKFSRADKAHEKVLDWIEQSAALPLYLAGDSGSGKSSLLNAFVLPTLRERGWTVVEARAWQDPTAALREALTRLADAKRKQRDDTKDVLTLIEAAAKRAGAKLLVVLDQFEEFVILGKSEHQHEFAGLLTRLKSASVNGLKLLLVLRSDYQTFLDEIGLPPPQYGENFYQVARFTLAAGTTFLDQSGLELQPDARDRLLISAAELDETPGLVRPITLNIIGHVLASSHTAPSFDAGQLIRRYIEQTVEQPAIRDFMPSVLEQLITEQGTKQPRSEEELATTTNLRHGEVRSALNGLGIAALARPLDPTQGVWELSHDFIARGVARYLGRRRRGLLRQASAYAAPVLLAITLLAIGSTVVWTRLSPYELEAQLVDLGFSVIRNGGGFAIERNSQFTLENFAKSGPLLARLSRLVALQKLDLSYTQVTSVEPLKGLTALQQLDLSNTQVASVEPLKGLTALQWLNLGNTQVASVEPLKGLTALRGLGLSNTQVTSVEPLKSLTALQRLHLSNTQVTSVEPLKGLTALQQLDLSDTQVTSVEPLKGLTALQQLYLGSTQVTSVELDDFKKYRQEKGLRQVQIYK
jgi:hypothetical protein